MDIPANKQSMRYALLVYLNTIGKVSKQKCVKDMCDYLPKSVRIAIKDMSEGGLIISENAQIKLSQKARNHFLDKQKCDVAAPRIVNLLFRKPLSGYDAYMMQNRRGDSGTPLDGYITSGTSLEPFRGVGIK